MSWTFLWTRWALAPLDWQAIATFAAVAAALWVGLRQTGIQTQQAQILEGQNKLKEAEIKVSLLGRRYDYIKETSVELYSSINDHERTTDFRIILRNTDMAQLIFRDEDMESIKEIIEQIQELDETKLSLARGAGYQGKVAFGSLKQEITDRQTQIENDLAAVLDRLKRYADVTF